LQDSAGFVSCCFGLRRRVASIASRGDAPRVTIISPGMVRTNFAEGVTNQTVKAQLEQSRDTFAMRAVAIARAITFAIEQPPDVDVNEIVVRPTAQK